MINKSFQLLATLLVALALPSSAFAQDEKKPEDQPEASSTTEIKAPEPPADPSAQPNNKVEKLQVTGSYIRRTDVEGPSPVVSIDRQQIEASGFDSVGAVLKASTVSPFGGDGATVNLRGIGSTRTLILINGQRAPKTGHSYDYVDGTNVNSVPLAAVERIDILKDGASATYGADALGGVVNIITRTDFDGLSVASKHNVTDPLGGDFNRSSVGFGWNTPTDSVLTAMQVIYNQGARNSSFPFIKAAPQSITSSPNYIAQGSPPAAGPNCGLVDPESGLCRENLTAQSYSEPSYSIGNVTTWNHNFGADAESYVTFLGNYSVGESSSVGSSFGTPGRGSGIFLSGTEAAAPTWDSQLGPGYSAGTPIRIFGRLDERRVTKANSTTLGLITGVKGYWGDSDWDWDISLNNQISLAQERRGNMGLIEQTTAGLSNGNIDPFGPAPDIGNFTADSVNNNRYQVNWLNAVTTGSLGSAIGGNWTSALGLSAAHFEFSDDSDDRVLDQKFMGLSGTEGRGERQLYSLFGELVGQFGTMFESQMSLRMDHYSDFGTPVSPKIALRFQPTAGLMFRASAGAGFKAPELQEAYGGDREGFFNGIIDSVRCQNEGPSSPACEPESYSGAAAANPNVREETSVNYNLGVVAEPMKNFSIGLDYWHVKVKGTIGLPPVQQLLDRAATGEDISSLIGTERDPSGELLRITTILNNLGEEEVDGIDLNMQYTLKTTAGDFTLATEHTYLFNYYQSFFPGEPREQLLGRRGTPRWRNVTSLGYRKGKWASRIVARSAARVENNQRNTGYVESFTQYDVSVDYELSKNGVIQIGALNAFDRQPRWDETRSTKIDSNLYRRFRIAFLSYRQTF